MATIRFSGLSAGLPLVRLNGTVRRQQWDALGISVETNRSRYPLGCAQKSRSTAACERSHRKFFPLAIPCKFPWCMIHQRNIRASPNPCINSDALAAIRCGF